MTSAWSLHRIILLVSNRVKCNLISFGGSSDSSLNFSDTELSVTSGRVHLGQVVGMDCANVETYL